MAKFGEASALFCPRSEKCSCAPWMTGPKKPQTKGVLGEDVVDCCIPAKDLISLVAESQEHGQNLYSAACASCGKKILTESSKRRTDRRQERN
jgi:hypothetical protein